MENTIWKALFNMAIGLDHREQIKNIFAVFEDIKTSGEPLEPHWFTKCMLFLISGENIYSF
jgi:hypothetical protein